LPNFENIGLEYHEVFGSVINRCTNKSVLLRVPKPRISQDWSYEYISEVNQPQECVAVLIMTLLYGLKKARCSIGQYTWASTMMGTIAYPLQLLAAPNRRGEMSVSQGVIATGTDLSELIITLKREPGIIVCQYRPKLKKWLVKFQSTLYLQLVSISDFACAHKEVIHDIFPYLYFSACMPGATVTVMEDMRKDWITLEPGKVRENPFILMDVVKQQDALLKLGIVHCDLRYPNILTRENQTRLIDLESLTCRPSSVQCIDSIDLAWSQSCVAGLCETAVWQISLLLGQAFAKDIRDRQNFVEWLTENQNVALFRLALDVENNGVIDTIDLVEVVGEAVRAL
jgi:hypothetical protein